MLCDGGKTYSTSLGYVGPVGSGWALPVRTGDAGVGGGMVIRWRHATAVVPGVQGGGRRSIHAYG